MNIIEIEETLLRCARAQQAKGLDIVCDVFFERTGHDITGCCALGALALETDRQPDEDLARAVVGMTEEQAESFTRGFDGWRRQFGGPFPEYFALGKRLRENLKPREARGA